MKTCIFLTTRYGSTRLPGKHLTDINGKTLTDILIKRLKRSKIPIIMCTPDTPEDNLRMKAIADRNNIGFFSGERQNIIKRHLDCALKHKIDFIINADGDDILVTPETIQSVYYCVQQMKELLPIRTVGLPLGLNVIAYPVSKLKEVNFDTDTGWGAQLFKGRYVEIPFRYDHDYRLTMDYSEDFDVIEAVLTKCKRNMTVGGICDWLLKHPDIAKSNLYLNKKYWERIGEAGK
jgi:spore coat polysaccharide biosynthesis protein SpsF (cytidylyltransferase family)